MAKGKTRGTLVTKMASGREIHRSTALQAGTTFADVEGGDITIQVSIKPDGESRVAWYRRTASGGNTLIREVALTPGGVDR